jgi:hypothetical protein
VEETKERNRKFGPEAEEAGHGRTEEVRGNASERLLREMAKEFGVGKSSIDRALNKIRYL